MNMHINSTTKILYCFESRCLLCTRLDDMIDMQILFFVAAIGTSKKKKSDFPCLFFEQGYLRNYVRYYYEIFYDSSSYPFQGKRVSDFVFRP